MRVLCAPHILSSWPGIAVRRTASLPLAYDPAIHVLPFLAPKDVNARDKPGHDESIELPLSAPYALAISGKTASILVFSVAALKGFTM
jgi:hypothetical protein